MTFGDRLTTLEEQITPIAGSTGNGCSRIGDIQVCWGSESRTAGPDSVNHVRCYRFDFAQTFTATPIVTNGINTQGSGDAFEVYSYNLDNTYYAPCLNNMLSAAGAVTYPVEMNYIAVGPWR